MQDFRKLQVWEKSRELTDATIRVKKMLASLLKKLRTDNR